jgi:hypothetical protein
MKTMSKFHSQFSLGIIPRLGSINNFICIHRGFNTLGLERKETNYLDQSH